MLPSCAELEAYRSRVNFLLWQDAAARVTCGGVEGCIRQAGASEDGLEGTPNQVRGEDWFARLVREYQGGAFDRKPFVLLAVPVAFECFCGRLR
jgi:hypothetical protein